jgi:RNA polymerase sigma-70 factor (ECF subfamily)
MPTDSAFPSMEDLLQQHMPRIYSLAYRMLGNQVDAEDVTQDVLLQVLRKGETFRGESAFSTWLHRIAVNIALAYRHKRAVRHDQQMSAPEEILEESSPVPPGRHWQLPPDQLLLNAETQRLIEDAIAQLPAMYRDVYLLADVEGLPNHEIADLLGLGMPAVKSRLHRARLRMRDALAPYFEETVR